MLLISYLNKISFINIIYNFVVFSKIISKGNERPRNPQRFVIPHFSTTTAICSGMRQRDGIPRASALRIDLRRAINQVEVHLENAVLTPEFGHDFVEFGLN